MQQVGLRALNQNASAVVRQVASSGESVEITDRGRAVARLVPLPQRDRLEELIAQGAVIPADGGDLLDVEPIALPPGSPSLSEILEEMRNDERY